MISKIPSVCKENQTASWTSCMWFWHHSPWAKTGWRVTFLEWKEWLRQGKLYTPQIKRFSVLNVTQTYSPVMCQSLIEHLNCILNTPFCESLSSPEKLAGNLNNVVSWLWVDWHTALEVEETVQCSSRFSCPLWGLTSGRMFALLACGSSSTYGLLVPSQDRYTSWQVDIIFVLHTLQKEVSSLSDASQNQPQLKFLFLSS